MMFAYGKNGTPDDQHNAWLMWASQILDDLDHIVRRHPFPPPAEVGGNWHHIRELAKKRRKMRGGSMRAEDKALLIDVGDYLIEVRQIETENAATLECLLHAAWMLWDANARQRLPAADRIYKHLADVWGVMPPPLQDLPVARANRVAMCRELMREHDLVPTWFLRGKPEPGAPRPVEDDESEGSVIPETGSLFRDVE